MPRVNHAALVTPARFTAASTITAATAAGRGWAGHAYAPKVSAMAAQLAVLPMTKPQPATKPHPSPRRWRP